MLLKIRIWLNRVVSLSTIFQNFLILTVHIQYNFCVFSFLIESVGCSLNNTTFFDYFSCKIKTSTILILNIAFFPSAFTVHALSCFSFFQCVNCVFDWSQRLSFAWLETLNYLFLLNQTIRYDFWITVHHVSMEI